MNITTSLSFASVAASGETWRDISKKVLEQLESIRTDGFKPNIGFLYITDVLAPDASSILTLFRSVTGIEHWSGCAALGVCANGAEFVDAPAISVLVGQLPQDKFKFFQTQGGTSFKQMHQELEPWLNKNDPMLTFTHADPLMETQPAKVLEEIDALVGGFMVGGLASSREEMVVLGRDVLSSGASGFVFSADIPVATALSQGCVVMGEAHEVSRSDDHVIAYLDGKRPLEVFTEDLKRMTQEKIGRTADQIVLQHLEEAPLPDLKGLFRGEAHIAFPVPGSDRSDYLVRNIMAIDPDTGMMAVSEMLTDGQKVMFVHRDDESVKTDLAHSLVALRERILHEQGVFQPKAALYVSCVARAGVAFGDDPKPGGEMALIREIIGDVPISGFYASGEISNTRLYGYTGVITLFL